MSWSNVGTLIVVVLLSYEVGLERASRVEEANWLPVFFLIPMIFLCVGACEVVMYSYLR